MSVIQNLATSLGRRDELPNIELAASVVAKMDAPAVSELVENLFNKSKGIRSDCIKTLYEIGSRKPELIAAHWEIFLKLLDASDNRLVWGAMTALHSITALKSGEIYAHLPKLLEIARKGSVITRDQLVNILIRLCSFQALKKEVFPLYREFLQTCPENQLAMYAENGILVIDPANCGEFVRTLQERLAGIEKSSRRKRIEKVIRKAMA